MKKTLKILFVMLFALCTLIPSVYADFNDSDVVMTVNGNYYTSFQSGWAKAFSLAGTGDEAYVKLMADWIPYNGKFYVEDYRGYETGTKDGTLYIDLDGITLDLNGHIIDRNLASGEKGRVILVEGATLTITDTSADKNGKITGGYLTGGNRGAGVSVNNGNLILNGGSIYGNSAESGAGVYIKNSTFTVNGGSVSENYASKNVAGVYLDGAGGSLCRSHRCHRKGLWLASDPLHPGLRAQRPHYGRYQGLRKAHQGLQGQDAGCRSGNQLRCQRFHRQGADSAGCHR